MSLSDRTRISDLAPPNEQDIVALIGVFTEAYEDNA